MCFFLLFPVSGRVEACRAVSENFSQTVEASSARTRLFLIEDISRQCKVSSTTAEGSQPVATGTVVQQEPVVLSGTVVGMEQPAPTAHAVQPPGKMPVVVAGAPPPTMVVQQPPVVMVSGVVQPAAPAPAGRWLGGNACGCCDPPGGCPLCCTAFWCPCVVVGQLWHRIVERGGGGTVLGILCGVTIAAYVLEWIVDAILYQYRPGWIFRLLAGFVYLHYMLKIRQAAAREGVPRPPRALRERRSREQQEPGLVLSWHACFRCSQRTPPRSSPGVPRGCAASSAVYGLPARVPVPSTRATAVGPGMVSVDVV